MNRVRVCLPYTHAHTLLIHKMSKINLTKQSTVYMYSATHNCACVLKKRRKINSKCTQTTRESWKSVTSEDLSDNHIKNAACTLVCPFKMNYILVSAGWWDVMRREEKTEKTPEIVQPTKNEKCSTKYSVNYAQSVKQASSRHPHIKIT